MSCFSSNIFSPLYIISPPLGISNKLIQRRSVDFPEPEEPIIQTTSPFSTEKSISFKTSCVPKDLFKCLTSITFYILFPPLFIMLCLMHLQVFELASDFLSYCNFQVHLISFLQNVIFS
mgnify:CR=1 FL=1